MNRMNRCKVFRMIFGLKRARSAYIKCICVRVNVLGDGSFPSFLAFNAEQRKRRPKTRIAAHYRSSNPLTHWNIQIVCFFFQQSWRITVNWLRKNLNLIRIYRGHCLFTPNDRFSKFLCCTGDNLYGVCVTSVKFELFFLMTQNSIKTKLEQPMQTQHNNWKPNQHIKMTFGNCIDSMTKRKMAITQIWMAQTDDDPLFHLSRSNSDFFDFRRPNKLRHFRWPKSK